MKRKQSTSIHPVLRAQMRAKWEAESVRGQIHALFGDNRELLLAYGSILFFVASACAIHTGKSDDAPQLRIIRGSINALDDLKERSHITLTDRGSIYAGMIASQELIQDTPIEIVDDAASIYDHMSREFNKESA